jgi:hypothetical protein
LARGSLFDFKAKTAIEGDQNLARSHTQIEDGRIIEESTFFYMLDMDESRTLQPVPNFCCHLDSFGEDSGPAASRKNLFKGRVPYLRIILLFHGFGKFQI